MKRQIAVLWSLTKVALVVLFAAWCALHLRRFDPCLGLSLPGWSHAAGVILIILLPAACWFWRAEEFYVCKAFFSMPGGATAA
jgi:hypothetical protein